MAHCLAATKKLRIQQCFTSPKLTHDTPFYGRDKIAVKNNYKIKTQKVEIIVKNNYVKVIYLARGFKAPSYEIRQNNWFI